MIRILIADDHSLIRAGLKQILSERSNIEVIEAENGKEIFTQLKNYDITAIVLDISMPGRNGLEILKEIKLFYPSIPVLILSVYSEKEYGMRAIKAGADGYLTKDSATENLIFAIDTILSGKKYLSASLAEQMISEITGKQSSKPSLHSSLSDREFEILKLIGKGLTPTQIAEQLFLSVKTVSTYRSRILEKMNMDNTSELMHYAIKSGLLQ